MGDKQKPDLLFDCLVQTIRNLKNLLCNVYEATLEDVDNLTRIEVE